MPQENWVISLVYPIIATTGQPVSYSAATVPSELPVKTSSKPKKSGFLFLGTQPLCSDADCARFTTYNSYVTNNGVVPNMSCRSPIIIRQSAEIDNIKRIGGSTEKVSYSLADFQQTYTVDLTQLLPPHRHTYAREGINGSNTYLQGSNVVDLQFSYSSFTTENTTNASSPNMMKYNLAPLGYVTSFYVKAAFGDDTSGDPRYMNITFDPALPDYKNWRFLSIANKAEYYSDNNIKITGDATYDSRLENLQTTSKPVSFPSTTNISVGTTNLREHTHTYNKIQYGSIGTRVVKGPAGAIAYDSQDFEDRPTDLPLYGNQTVPNPISNGFLFSLIQPTTQSDLILPIGTIISIYTDPNSPAPLSLLNENLLYCDGRVISNTDYPALVTLINGGSTTSSANLPDFATYGYGLYQIGNTDSGTGDFATTLNKPLFDPLDTSKNIYTIFETDKSYLRTDIITMFKITESMFDTLNPDLKSKDSIDENTLVYLPNTSYVRSHLYYRIPPHTHGYTQLTSNDKGNLRVGGSGNSRVFDRVSSTTATQTSIPNTLAIITGYQPFTGLYPTSFVNYYILAGPNKNPVPVVNFTTQFTPSNTETTSQSTAVTTSGRRDSLLFSKTNRLPFGYEIYYTTSKQNDEKWVMTLYSYLRDTLPATLGRIVLQETNNKNVRFEFTDSFGDEFGNITAGGDVELFDEKNQPVLDLVDATQIRINNFIGTTIRQQKTYGLNIIIHRLFGPGLFCNITSNNYVFNSFPLVLQEPNQIRFAFQFILCR